MKVSGPLPVNVIGDEDWKGVEGFMLKFDSVATPSELSRAWRAGSTVEVLAESFEMIARSIPSPLKKPSPRPAHAARTNKIASDNFIFLTRARSSSSILPESIYLAEINVVDRAKLGKVKLENMSCKEVYVL